MTRALPPTRPAGSLRVAVGFLTRVPVATGPVDDDRLRAASAWFPLVGLLVAAVEAGVRLAAGVVLPVLPASVLAVAAAVAVTGALHEDGLADSVDGLGGGRTPEERLRIMRDSRLGTYGATALVLALALRVALVAELDGWALLRALTVGHVVSRAAMLAAAQRATPARRDGQAARLLEPLRGLRLVAPLTVAVVAALLAGRLAPVVLALAVGVALLVETAGRRRVGGMTGDLLGATQQLALLAVLATTVTAVPQAAG